MELLELAVSALVATVIAGALGPSGIAAAIVRWADAIRGECALTVAGGKNRRRLEPQTRWPSMKVLGRAI
jgi:hypothetical protein